MQLRIAVILVITLMTTKSTLEEGVSGNLALHAKTGHSSKWAPDTDSSKAVDGRIDATNFPMNFVSGELVNDPDPYWYVDLELSYLIQTVEVISRRDCCLDKRNIIEVRVGEELNGDSGTTNPLCGEPANLDSIPKHIFRCEIYGRYVTIKKANIPAATPLIFLEVMINKEPTTHISLRTNGLGTHARTFYEGRDAYLYCPAVGFPKPHVAWVRDGVVLQNTTTNGTLKWTVNDTKGSINTYGCLATNVHGKDYYPVAVTVAGRYSMCIKPEEIRDPTRNRFSKQDSSLPPKSDATTFDQNKMYTFFNPQSSRYMKLATSCPAPSSCGTGAPGWLSGPHPKPEHGIQRSKVCFHYDGDCCYKSLYIYAVNCPGMYVYELTNTVELDFPARYCFEDDKYFEAFAPFKSVPTLYAPVGATNNALVNHVVAKESGIEDTSQCLTVCMMKKCRSFNFAKFEKICEVSDVTKDEYPRDLSAKPGFQYYHPMKTPMVVNNGYN